VYHFLFFPIKNTEGTGERGNNPSQGSDPFRVGAYRAVGATFGVLPVKPRKKRTVKDNAP